MIPNIMMNDLRQAGDYLPQPALQWALDHWDEAASPLLDLMRQYMDDEDRSKEAESAIFFAVHLFGEKREYQAFPALCRFLENGDASEKVLGDAITENVRGILIATWNGDSRPLMKLIESTSADEFARAAALEALAYLARTGRWDEKKMRAYMLHLRANMRPRGNSFVWSNWAMTAANLGYVDLSADVEDLISRGWIFFRDMNLKDFESQLHLALSDPAGIAGFERDRIRPFTDTIGNLSRWYGFSEEYRRKKALREAESIQTPEQVIAEVLAQRSDGEPAAGQPRPGRNDPCPCGSGKKYKKCCLT